MFSAPYRLAPYRVALYRLAPRRSAPYRLAPRRLAPYRVALYRLAPRRLAPYRLAPRRLAPRRLAPYRSAPYRSAPRRLALHRVAPRRLASIIVSFIVLFSFSNSKSNFPNTLLIWIFVFISIIDFVLTNICITFLIHNLHSKKLCITFASTLKQIDMENQTSIRLELGIDARRIMQHVQINNEQIEQQLEKGIQLAISDLTEGDFIEVIRQTAKDEIQNIIRKELLSFNFQDAIVRSLRESAFKSIEQYSDKLAEKITKSLDDDN